MRLLITNDDGYRSCAYRALIKELSRSFELLCVAPENQRSWIGKAFTSGQDLMIQEVKTDDGRSRFHHCPGTPADCIQLGLHHFVESSDITAVVSGMNFGRNDGVSRILSSGTLGAAFEGAVAGKRSFAISIASTYTIADQYDFYSDENIPLFERHARIAAKVIRRFLQHEWTDFQVLSCNIPLAATEETPVVITKPATNYFGSVFSKTENGFRFHSPKKLGNDDAMTDEHAIANGLASLSPISLEFTMPASLEAARNILQEVC